MSRIDENSQEFTRAVEYATAVRHRLGGAFGRVKTNTIQNRLTKRFYDAIMKDAIHARGERVFLNENAPELNGALGKTSIFNALYLPTQIKIEGDETGKVGVLQFSRPIEAVDFKPPKGATHARFLLTFSRLRFDTEEFPVIEQEEYTHDLKDIAAGVTAVQTAQIPLSDDTLYLLVYLQEVNGTMYPLENQQFTYADIVAV